MGYEGDMEDYRKEEEDARIRVRDGRHSKHANDNQKRFDEIGVWLGDHDK